MSELNEREIKKFLYWLIAVFTVLRIFIGSTLEFSVDEVYYWTYALYPDWSHFDHPPMVGWVIQLFTLNLLFENEFTIRLGAIVFAACNTLLIYSIGKNLKNPLTGLYAALLFNASVYCSVLAGNFIIPDSPQLLFWLLSLKYLLRSLPKTTIARRESIDFLLACLFIGLAIISKYHGVFIWVGAGLYVLFFNRSWLKVPAFYAGALLSALFVIPIVVWNIQNDWISFTFHGDRVASAFRLRFDYLFTELFGQVAYNNPVNYILIVLSLVALYKGKIMLDKNHARILILNSIPIWLVFTSFSLFRQTLPHWTGPAFTPLILIASVYLSQKTENRGKDDRQLLFPVAIKGSLYLLIVMMMAAWGLINYFPGTIGKKTTVSKYGDTDFTLDMYGWKQIKTGFEAIAQRDVETGSMSARAPIISPKYFPGTEIDFYVARPLNRRVLQYGKLSDIHKYAWINEERGHLKAGEDAYMISTSNWFKDPNEYYADNFEKIIPTDTITITRSGKVAYFAFIYKLKNYRGNFQNPLHTASNQ
jgi:4-amino-4-deoxy-L-arabinose transferase-like glycosyltransferase